jgi:hypothetical protein
MEELLTELQVATTTTGTDPPPTRTTRRTTSSDTRHIASTTTTTTTTTTATTIPHSTGSFVQPGQEYVTTNLFVGNLASTITEQHLQHVFAPFGDLYSVKIMYARTVEEKMRGRHSGFCCFVHRQDAEDAMDALNDTDPFQVGRRIWVRWGKDVKSSCISSSGNTRANLNTTAAVTDLGTKARADVLDGGVVATGALSSPSSSLARRMESIRRNKMQGGLHRAFGSSRQRQQQQESAPAEGGGAGEARLRHQQQQEEDELADEFDRLFAHELCASRGAISRAMAFCFEKSAAWHQISALLHNLMVQQTDCWDDRVDIKIAQLYVLSDILFNAQQPGVRNAFRYRDSIEKMAPDVFGSFGENTVRLGRLTRNKVATAVSAVLAAWTNWSVYSASFLDELHARFEGRTINSATTTATTLTIMSGIGGSGGDDPDKIRVHSDDDSDTAGETLLSGSHGHAHCEDEADGSPIGDDDDDVDGSPIVPTEDVGGSNDIDEDDVDGLPIGSDSDDADGVPLEPEDAF